MKSVGGSCMRAVAIVSILIMASLTPIIAYAEPIESDLQKLGAPLSDDWGDAPITYGFSPSVRNAFARVSDLSQYSMNQLEATSQWVVVSDNPVGQPSEVLENVWIMEIDYETAIGLFAEWQKDGYIETAYPLIEKDMRPKWTPNDSLFSEQWHLQNTGQINGGVSREDVNITGTWNNYRGI